MILKYLILLAFIFQCYIVNAQVYKLRNDKKCLTCAPSSFIDINKNKGREVENKIEFNLWFRDLSDTLNTLIQVKQDKDGIWHGQRTSFFSWDWQDLRILKEDTLAFDRKWNTLWNNLLAHNFLSLETFSKAKSKWRRKPGDIILYADGNSLCVEIFTLDRSHAYQYTNLEAIKNEYHDNKALNNAVFVVNSLTTYFNLK